MNIAVHYIPGMTLSGALCFAVTVTAVAGEPFLRRVGRVLYRFLHWSAQVFVAFQLCGLSGRAR